MSKSLSTSSNEISFIVNGYQLSGVTDVDGSYSITETPINVLGYGYVISELSSPFVGSFNVSRNMVSKDVILPYTGDDYFNGSIVYKDKNFGFTSGYLTNYSIACAVGEIPIISNSISAFGDMGGEVLEVDALDSKKLRTVTQNHPAIEIPQQGSISINCSGSSSNRVSRFNYSVSCQREPIYGIGTTYPIQIQSKYPVEIDATFTLEIDDYESAKVRKYLTSPCKERDDIEITISDPSDDSIIESYKIHNASLIGESINSSYGKETSVELSYKGYVNKNRT